MSRSSARRKLRPCSCRRRVRRSRRSDRWRRRWDGFDTRLPRSLPARSCFRPSKGAPPFAPDQEKAGRIGRKNNNGEWGKQQDGREGENSELRIRNSEFRRGEEEASCGRVL